MQNSKYLAQEKIPKLLLKFSLPCILSLIVSALYNIVDQIFIGNHPDLGYLGNAATSIVFPITMTASAISWCFGDGVAALMSIKQGKKSTNGLDKPIANALVASLGASLILTAISLIFRHQILRLFGASDESLSFALEYYTIIVAAFPIYMVGNTLSSIIRADGSPNRSMAVTLVGAIINIIFDPILIFGLNMGMAGAAIATIGGQFVSFLIGAEYLRHTKTFKFKAQSFRPEFKTMQSFIRLGISSLFTNLSVVAIALTGNYMLAATGANSIYGSDIPVAALGIASKVFTIVINIVVGLIAGAQPILGYNIGAKNYDRVRKTFRIVLSISIAVGIFFTLIFEFFPLTIVNIFGNNGGLYEEFAIICFRIYLSLITFTCTIKMISIFFQSVGEPIKAIICSLVRDIVCFIPLAIILPIFFGIYGVLLAAPIADLIGIVVAFVTTRRYFKTLTAPQAGTLASDQIQASHPGVIVAISRQHGSAGKYIGELVAQQLQIPYYYKEAIARAAKDSGLDAEFISKINEDGPSALRTLYLSSQPVEYAIEAQNKALQEIAKAGSCVIVGRAADYVLRNNQQVLRVFIQAPDQYRLAKLHEMYGDSAVEAKRNLAKSDKARSSYYELVSGQTWGDSQNYHLVIDSSIGAEATAAIIADYAKNFVPNQSSPITKRRKSTS